MESRIPASDWTSQKLSRTSAVRGDQGRDFKGLGRKSALHFGDGGGADPEAFGAAAKNFPEDEREMIKRMSLPEGAGRR